MKLRSVRLHEQHVVRRKPHVDNEINAAIADLVYEHAFRILSHDPGGAHDLDLRLEDDRLVFDLCSDADQHSITLPLRPFRAVVRNYFMMCESFAHAVIDPTTQQVETIDAGRRSVHNEGALLLQTLLQDKIEVDFPTARRLFALVAALHLGGWRG